MITGDTTVVLLYSLLKEHVLPGALDDLVRECGPRDGLTVLTNEHLAGYAAELARRLRGPDTSGLEIFEKVGCAAARLQAGDRVFIHQEVDAYQIVAQAKRVARQDGREVAIYLEGSTTAIFAHEREMFVKARGDIRVI